MSIKSKEVSLFLVEDDDVDAMSIERSFNQHKIGNQIIRASDGLDALEMLRRGDVPSPRVILLDLEMPRMNGHEFLKELRKDSDLSSSIVFILTTSSAEKDIDESYKLHAAGYFCKTDSGKNFMDVISTLDSFWKIAHFPVD
jgi:CheY-like chemotaxis protein